MIKVSKGVAGLLQNVHSRTQAWANSSHFAMWGIDFYQLPSVLLRRALETLVKQGKAQIFEGTERGQGLEGVKFAA